MAEFYFNSEYCVAYLADVPAPDSFSAMKASLRESEWFTRGWTLQKLLFPTNIIFCSKTWEILGQGRPLEKTEPIITEITGIPRECLKTHVAARRRSVAQRMSWAASRSTTRIEDEAYSLLGLFDVNMPLLYGEGSKAIIRLQEEIIRRSDDETIFAWKPPAFLPAGPWSGRFGILARTVRWFQGRGDLVNQRLSERKPYHITNRGFEFEATALKFQLPWPHSQFDHKYQSIYVIQLNCYSRTEYAQGGQSACLLALEKEDNVYYRVRARYTSEQLWASLLHAAVRVLELNARTFYIATAEADTFGELLSHNAKAYKVLTLNERWRRTCADPSPFEMIDKSSHGTGEGDSDDCSGVGNRYLAKSMSEEMAMWAEHDF